MIFTKTSPQKQIELNLQDTVPRGFFFVRLLLLVACSAPLNIPNKLISACPDKPSCLRLPVFPLIKLYFRQSRFLIASTFLI
jgi:hypothetical protein